MVNNSKMLFDKLLSKVSKRNSFNRLRLVNLDNAPTENAPYPVLKYLLFFLSIIPIDSLFPFIKQNTL